MKRQTAVLLITLLLLMQGEPGYSNWQQHGGATNGNGTNNAFDISSVTTDNITEGTLHKYYLDNRTRAALSASGPLSYNSSTGAFSLGTVPITSGGTGSVAVPTKGQMLIGNDNGTFSLNTLTGGSNVTITNDNGSVTIAASTAGAPLWGDVGGTLSSQTDLQNALNAKEASVSTGTSNAWYNGTKNWFALYSDNATEGTANLYFTNARAVSAIGSGTSGNWYNGTNRFYTLYADNVTNAVKSTTAPTYGQVLTGNSDNATYTPALLTAGSGISVTPGNHSVTIAATGGGSAYNIDNLTLSLNNGVIQVANWLIDDVMLAFFKLAYTASLTIFNMVDGVFDQLENQAGIDNRSVAWTDNMTYDGTNKLWYPTSQNIPSYSTNTGWAAIYGGAGATAIGEVFTLPNSITVSGIQLYAAKTGSPSGYVQIMTYNSCTGTVGSTGVPSGSPMTTDNISLSTLSSAAWITVTLTTPAVFTGNCGAVIVSYTGGNGSNYPQFGVASGGGYAPTPAQNDAYGSSLPPLNNDPNEWFEFKLIGSAQGGRNTRLTSVPTAAAFNPTKARLVFFEQDNTTQGITLNTDLKAYASSDNGTTWQQATLTNDGAYAAGMNILSGTATVTGGSNQMRWRLQTTNDNATVNKSIILRGASITWQ